jgi:group I intron endonuclease
MHLIYKYTSPSGKCYIGKTQEATESNRKYQHSYDSRKGSSTAFHCAIRKYGFDAFTYEVLMSGIPNEIINGMEIIYIDLYKPEYNHTTGGDGVDSETARRVANERWADPEDTAKRVAAMKGKKKTITDAWRKAASVKTSNRNKVWNTIEYTCPHCSKVGKGPNMKRYHFDKCKDFGGGAFEGVMNAKGKK